MVGMGQREHHMDGEPRQESYLPSKHAIECGSLPTGWDGECDTAPLAVIPVAPEKHHVLRQ